MHASSDPLARPTPGDAQRAALEQRGFALLRGILTRAEIADLRRELGEGRRDALARLPRFQALLEAWFGARLRTAECELAAAPGGGGEEGRWRQEYGCSWRAGELVPFTRAGLIQLAPGPSARLELELAPGSHRTGRLAHRLRAGGSAAVAESARALLATAPAEAFELAPGDVLLLHANLLHRLRPNRAGRAAPHAVARFELAT